MIIAVVKIQNCTTRKGRRAFVGKDWPRHGIAAGAIRYYKITGKNWGALRSVVAMLDSTGARTMGFSNVHPKTVVCYIERTDPISKTAGGAASAIPYPPGTSDRDFQPDGVYATTYAPVRATEVGQ